MAAATNVSEDTNSSTLPASLLICVHLHSALHADSPVLTFSSPGGRQILLVVFSKPTRRYHAVSRAHHPELLCLPLRQTHKRQLCPFSNPLGNALGTARGSDPGRGHEMCRTCLSVHSWPGSPRGLVHPLGEDTQDRGTNIPTLKRELFAHRVSPCLPSSPAPKRCCITSMASCLRSPPCLHFILSHASYNTQH